MIKTLTAALAALAAAGALAAPPAHADPYGCVIQPWGFLGSQQRGICDNPMRADGSWMRHRIIAFSAAQIPLTCSGNTYGGGSWANTMTTCSGGYYRPYTETDNEWYSVTADTVLPDEPGYLR